MIKVKVVFKMMKKEVYKMTINVNSNVNPKPICQALYIVQIRMKIIHKMTINVNLNINRKPHPEALYIVQMIMCLILHRGMYRLQI